MIKIGNKIISKKSPVFIIAEAGVNHNGRLDLAKKLVDVAKEAGADAVKFQAFKAEDIVTRHARQTAYQQRNIGRAQSQFAMLKKLELSKKQFAELKNYCDKKKIIFLNTPHTLGSIEEIKSMVAAFKVGSADLNNHYFLRQLAKLRKPILLSTGMSNIDEIKKSLQVIYKTGNRKVIVLQCTTEYPCPPDEVNLNAMLTLEKKLKMQIGYSDHSEGIQAAIMAATLGAVVIEKHLTINKNLPGPDHKASSDPEEFEAMVRAVRLLPRILGSGKKRPTTTELKTAKVARKSIVAICDIRKGEKFSLKNIGIKRPSGGLSPEKFEQLLGRTSKKNIKVDAFLKKTDYV